MKKSIGLTADLSTFNTTLPQTRHLNYFMNTNPRGFAKGGDVKAGIPNYPNPNVTSGFLPMALGFDNGGEADGYFSKLYKAAVKVVAGYLGKSEDDEEVQDIAKKFIETDNGKAIANKLLTQDEAYKVDVPSDRQPQFNIPQPLTPKDTVTASPEPPSVPSDIDREREIKALEQSPIKPYAPGISGLQPKETEPKEKQLLDLNGDGEVNLKDLEYAVQNGLEWAIPMLKKLLNIVEDWNPDEPEKIVPETPEIVPETAEIVPEKPEDNKKIKPELKIKPPRDDDGIAGVPPKGAVDVTGKTTLNEEDQKTLKIASDIEEGGDGGIDTLKNKKDVPAWALPMMSAGFAMMASKNPNFLGALGEAGQAGVESYSAQEASKEAKLDKKSLRDLRKAQGENLKDNKGSLQLVGGKYFYKDGTPYMIDNPNGTRTHASKVYTREEIIEKLSTNMEFTMLMDKADKTQADYDKIEKIIAQTTAIFNSGEGGSSINNANKLEEDVKKKSWFDIIESWNPDS